MTAKIGHNRGPFETTSQHIADLFDDAKNWLDGEDVTDEKTAVLLNEKIGEARKAKTACNVARKDEAKFWNEGKQEVQDRYNPFLRKCQILIDAAQLALGPWLLAQETAKRERDAKLAADATKAKAEAVALMQASGGDPEKRQEAEYRLADSKEMDKIAKQEAKKNIAHGARSRWKVEIEDRTEAARAIWIIAPEAFDDLLVRVAEDKVSHGARQIRGFTITERIVV